MNQLKEQRLIIEADAKEINQLQQELEQIIRQLFIQFRASCHLSLSEAAQIAEIDRKTLSAHERGHDMYVSTLCNDLATFILYMKWNKIKENEELRNLKAIICKLLTE